MAEFQNLGAAEAAVSGGAAVSRGAAVAGASLTEAATLTPIEMMSRLGEPWLRGATAAEKADVLRSILRNDKASQSLLRMLDGPMGEKVLSMAPNKIPKALLKAAGSAKKQAQFTQTLALMREFKAGGPSKKDLRKLFGLTMRAAVQAEIPASQLDALRRLGPERVFRGGATNIVRVLDITTEESSARRLWRWATKGDPTLGGKKLLGTGPTNNLANSIRTQIDDLDGIAKSRLSDEVSAAKGVFGKAGAAIKGGAARVSEAVNPKGFTVAEEGIVSQLKAVGAKGLGKGARALRAFGGKGTLFAIPFLGHELYKSLVGKSKRARASLEASRRGGTASVGQELMFDMLDKRADLEARRARLAQTPQLMQNIVQALSGPQSQRLTTSEVGLGVDLGQGGISPGQMDKLINELLGQMRGM